MELIYERHHQPARVGTKVKAGDRVMSGKGDWMEVMNFREPHKPSSEGFVSVVEIDGRFAPALSESKQSDTALYYVSVIGAKWIGRDRLDFVDRKKEAWDRPRVSLRTTK